MKVHSGNKMYLSGGSSENTSDSQEDEALTDQEFPTVDVRDQCPKYAAIVDGRLVKPSMEDVDSLQLELETLLVAVVQRKQQLREQFEALDHDDSIVQNRERNRSERDKGEKRRSASPLQGTSQSKRSRPNTADHKSAKKSSKDRFGKSALTFGIEAVTESVSRESSSSADPKVPKGPKGPSGQDPTGKVNVPPTPSNDTPHRFWTYLDDYCKPVSDEQIQALENMLETQEAIKFSDYVKVPPLGTHYTVKWAHEDLREEQKEAAPDASSVDLIENMETVLHETAKQSLNDERYGTLTQRLMSCLIEENVIVRPEGDIPIVVPQARTTSTLNVASIEQRIRKELEELGVVQTLNQKVEEEDDEVFLELRKCQSQLLSISAQNARMLRTLVESARRRQMVQKLEGRLRTVDNQIRDHFRRRRGSARSSRTTPLALPPPSKQDKEQLRELLNERKVIVSQLDSLPQGARVV